jgi:hypothetical protein
MYAESTGVVIGFGNYGTHKHNKGYQTDTPNPYFLHPNNSP